LLLVLVGLAAGLLVAGAAFGGAIPGAEPTSTLPGLAAVPTFAQLIDAGRVGRGQPLVLGFDRHTGAELAGSWLDLYSCAVGGLAGSGKSWTAVFLASQAALYGARLLILDPHAQHPESLSMRLAPLRRSFVCAVADTPGAMRAAVELATHELQRRITSGQRATPWIVLADEFSSPISAISQHRWRRSSRASGSKGVSSGCTRSCAARCGTAAGSGAASCAIASPARWCIG
jgi:hypothetical protein